MQFTVLTRRRTDRFPESAFTPDLLDAEAGRVRELYAQGFIRQIWMRGDVPGACLTVEADDAQKVRDTLHTLPLHQRDMLELVAVVPLKPYRAFCPQT